MLILLSANSTMFSSLRPSICGTWNTFNLLFCTYWRVIMIIIPSSFHIKFRIHTRGLPGRLGEDRHLPRAGECDRPLFYYLPCRWFRLYAYFLLPWLFLYFIFIEFDRLINKPSLLLFVRMVEFSDLFAINSDKSGKLCKIDWVI